MIRAAGIVLGLTMLTSFVPGAEADWRVEYRRGLSALQGGKLAKARKALELAVAQQPRAEQSTRTYGVRQVGYLPYLHLSILAYRERDLTEARRYLTLSRAEGVAETTEQGRLLLAEQELLLENLEFLAAAGRPGGPPARTEVDEQREQELAREVATACGEPPPRARREMPWYYHYRLSRRLAENGDWMGSLQHVALALERREEPGEMQRTYGMGFVHYRPWLAMGRAHARLGNWDCAVDALELSQAREQIIERDVMARRERDETLAAARERLAVPSRGADPP